MRGREAVGLKNELFKLYNTIIRKQNSMRYIIIILILSFVGCENIDSNRVSYSDTRFIEQIESNINSNSCFKIKFQNNFNLDSFFISKYTNEWVILSKRNDSLIEEPFVNFNLSVGDTIYSSSSRLFDRILLDKKNDTYFILEKHNKQIFQNVPGESISWEYYSKIYVVTNNLLVDIIKYGISPQKVIFISDISNGKYNSKSLENKIFKFYTSN